MLFDYLEENYKNHYLILNISDEHYDPGYFNNSVKSYLKKVCEMFFPGYSCPPLGVVVDICMIIERWLNSDENNIVLIHCKVK